MDKCAFLKEPNQWLQHYLLALCCLVGEVIYTRLHPSLNGISVAGTDAGFNLKSQLLVEVRDILSSKLDPALKSF